MSPNYHYVYTNPVNALKEAYGGLSQVEPLDIAGALARQGAARITWRVTSEDQTGLTGRLQQVIAEASASTLGEEATQEELAEISGIIETALRSCCFGKLPHEE